MPLIITQELVHYFSVLERGFEVQISHIVILLCRLFCYLWLAEELLQPTVELSGDFIRCKPCLLY